MTVNELIALLQKQAKHDGGNTQVMLLDSHNGGGNPRELNLGPVRHNVTLSDSEETADCEGMLGEVVVVLGYGCY